MTRISTASRRPPVAPEMMPIAPPKIAPTIDDDRADRERDARALVEAREHVAADAVRSHRVRARRPLQRRADIDRQRVDRPDEAAEEREEHEQAEATTAAASSGGSCARKTRARRTPPCARANASGPEPAATSTESPVRLPLLLERVRVVPARELLGEVALADVVAHGLGVALGGVAVAAAAAVVELDRRAPSAPSGASPCRRRARAVGRAQRRAVRPRRRGRPRGPTARSSCARPRP